MKAQHEKARKLLEEHRAKLDELASYLYEKETITGDEFMTILNREGKAAEEQGGEENKNGTDPSFDHPE